MRIAIITQEDPFYLPPALNTLCQTQKDNIVALIVTPSFNEKITSTAKRLYHFYGAFDFSRLLAYYAWAKALNHLNYWRPLTRPYSASEIAHRYDIDLYQPSKINAANFVDTLKHKIRPDLLVSVAASQILKKSVLEVPPLGCINLHSAPLPRYQGMMPNFWTMVNNEPEATVTIHYMVEKLDAGDIILQKSVPINPSDSLHDLMVRSKIIGAKALLEAIDKIEAGTVDAKPQDSTQATYFSFPTRKDAHRLRFQGRRLL
ncbi:methionyl-tRNA formyltransferase [Mastigocoleus testarum]|uniref:Formyl transferase N-terminal domain-containing protein n=1 Tax=Mastigocoleus testarum BC008 TaxID=371196 RepID=A0A0V7ZMV3_9CYAN|nr:formyltransferase family protein [Mastigocoleus testarum]KST66016.1 hypothetical protein BC008_23875 [Mastigocoleus testarum BC008]